MKSLLHLVVHFASCTYPITTHFSLLCLEFLRYTKLLKKWLKFKSKLQTERTNITDSLEMSRNVMIDSLPSLIYSKIKRECNCCFTSHPSQTQHSCLEEVSEEDRTYRIKHGISPCACGMINMVFACNGRPIPYVDVVAVKAMYGTEIIEYTKLETFSKVDSEDMVMYFYLMLNYFTPK